MAVGVAAFALVTLMALLPTGLNTFNATMNNSVANQIAQRIIADLQVADFSTITNTNRFFNGEGNEMTNAGDSNQPQCTYWVQVAMGTNETGQMASTFMGNTSSNLYTVIISVAHNPSHRPASVVFSGSNPGVITFSTLIGN